MPFANGHTMALTYNMDSLGKLYVSIVIAWSSIVLMGAAFLVSRRNLSFLRMRNIPLAVSAAATLHVYWILCIVAYVLNGYFPCAAEFWIMSIYLPLGMALFQACNMQLLYIADLQRRYTLTRTPSFENTPAARMARWRRYLCDLRAENKVRRTMTFIGFGMVVQVIMTLFIFLISFKFHPGFGLTARKFSPATEQEYCFEFVTEYHTSSCAQAQKAACRRGWEWMPSIVWQFVWTWCCAPYLLWQLRDVKDVHGWRKQTVICCLAGLFATPMWLCGIYIPAMSEMSKYYIPPMWFAPSIFLIEACLIFVPCWQIVKNRRLQTQTLNIIAEWENKNNGSSIGADTMESISKVSKKASTTGSTGSRRGEMYTMAALESALRTNPQNLLLFAAQKDFSGENINFLTKILDWKRCWSPSSPKHAGYIRRPGVCESHDKVLRRQQFKTALDIYACCVSPKYSHYPVNLSHVHLKELETVFEGASMMTNAHIGLGLDSATPFEQLWRSPTHEDVETGPGKDASSVASTRPINETNNSYDDILNLLDNNGQHSILQAYELRNISDQLPDFIPIPSEFGPEVFERAEESIKYMVLTNTWPKFVKDKCDGTTSMEKKNFLEGVRNRFLTAKH